ncbi:hypothetical protein AB0O34_22545 [Sphaerisporangium sp. NPDC088356]|uniref:hypothetical protein n=1 Tax=Sphaerisporangium sp. NPDC088356 TaxID=3154871 RepID=UPI0034429B9E
MSTFLSRITATAAALTLAAVLAPPAHAASPEPVPVPDAGSQKIISENSGLAPGPLKLVLGSLQAYDLEESGQDEVRIEVKADGGEWYKMWPTNGTEANTKVNTCWVLTSTAAGCSPGSAQPSAGPYVHLTLAPGARFTIEVWEDDVIGDDLLLSIPVTVMGGTQIIDASSTPGKGFRYRLVARIE